MATITCQVNNKKSNKQLRRTQKVKAKSIIDNSFVELIEESEGLRG